MAYNNIADVDLANSIDIDLFLCCSLAKMLQKCNSIAILCNTSKE